MGFLRQLLDIITAPVRLLLSAPRRLFDGSRRLTGISLAARLAILTALLLIVVAVCAVLGFIYTHERPFWQAKLTPLFITTTVILVLVIPLVLYKALSLWLEGEVSPYPDIDLAWKAGMEELERQRIDPKFVPLFLILGTSSLRQEKAIFDASRLDLTSRDLPAGTAALHWYAGPDAIYLVCSNVGCLSRVAELGDKAVSADRSNAERSRGTERGAERQQSAPQSIKGTLVIGSLEPRAAKIAAAHGSVVVPSRPSIQGTMITGTQTADPDSSAGLQAAMDEKRVIKLDAREIADHDRRVAYLARLIRRLRQPVCPINGILTVLPFGMIQRSRPDAASVERAVRSDLSALQRGLMVRCPVTALVAGLEEEAGFRELVRRVDRERVVNQRFGKGFSVANLPLDERLEALAIHACGAFEDWIYTLFREKDALNKPGNSKLYTLLCKVRHRIQDPLVQILVGGYAAEAGDAAAAGSRFGGCYFAAAGEGDERQAFIAAVVGKLPEQQEDLEWTEEALKQDDHYRLASELVLALDLVLLLVLVGKIFYMWFWK